MMTTVYLGLGSNVGNRLGNIRQAVDSLSRQGVCVERLSTIIESAPVGGPSQGNFLNAVLEGQTALSPQNLLIKVKAIERSMGRTTTVRFGPRVIDIDILLYGRLNLITPDLVIPHPRMRGRAFVMDPLREINPALAEELEHEDRH